MADFSDKVGSFACKQNQICPSVGAKALESEFANSICLYVKLYPQKLPRGERGACSPSPGLGEGVGG